MEEQEEEGTRDNNEQQIHSKAQVQQPGRCQEGSGEQNPRDGILPPQPAAVVGVCAAQGEQMDRWTGCRQCSTAQGMDQGGGIIQQSLRQLGLLSREGKARGVPEMHMNSSREGAKRMQPDKSEGAMGTD